LRFDRFDALYYFDQKLNTSYVIAKVEKRMSVVLLYKKKVKKGDSSIHDVLGLFTQSLRNVKILEKLSPVQYR